MGPRGNRYWKPFVRLGTCFVAVVVGLNLLLYLARPESVASASEGARRTDYFERKKRKIERHLRTLERFIDRIPGMGPPETGRVTETQELAWGYAQDVEPLAIEAPVAVSLDPPEPRFAWPVPLPELPRMEHALYEPMSSPELVRDWYRRNGRDPVSDVGDALLGPPELLFDAVLDGLAAILPRSRIQTVVPERDEGILTRVLDFQKEPRSGRLFTEFLGHFAERERRYFSRFEDSRVSTVGFEEGTEDADLEALEDDQKKILWDAFRKTYFSKYRFRAEERIRDDAFHFNDWRGMDFAVLPPVMAGYLWYRGLEKRFSVAGTSLQVSFEPVSEWIGGRDMIGGAGVEWAPTRGFPVALIVSFGLYDGDAEMDFIGIGTSLGMARKAVTLQHPDVRRD